MFFILGGSRLFILKGKTPVAAADESIPVKVHGTTMRNDAHYVFID